MRINQGIQGTNNDYDGSFLRWNATGMPPVELFCHRSVHTPGIVDLLVSFAAVFLDVTQRSPQTPPDGGTVISFE